MAVPMLAVEVTPGSVADVLATIDSRAPGARQVIVGHNLHSVYLYHCDPVLADVYRTADAVLVDGQPVRLAGWLTNRRADVWDPSVRVGSVDWLRKVGQLKTVSRIAVVGGLPPVNEATVGWLAEQSSTQVRGWPGYPWGEQRARSVVEELGEFDPDLTLVGLGMPLQEQFLHRHLLDLPPSTYALVGGAIDQLVGHQKRAPQWVGRIGMEWMWRFLHDPRRLAHRYVVEPWKLIGILVKQRF